jgi:hypothetical protein
MGQSCPSHAGAGAVRLEAVLGVEYVGSPERAPGGLPGPQAAKNGRFPTFPKSGDRRAQSQLTSAYLY